MFSAVLKGKDFASACKNGAHGKIHSIFERAINIQTDGEDQLLTILCEDVDIMPSACIVDAHCGSWENLASPGDKAILASDIMYINCLPCVGEISIAALWESLSDDNIRAMRKPSYSKILEICREIEAYLNKSGKNAISDISSILIDTPIDVFDPVDFIGLGSGLTPAGDDFLAGILFGAQFFEILYDKSCPRLPKIRDAVSKNFHRTGTISRHFLRYAIEGKWGRNTENFLIALVKSALDERNELYTAMNKKLSYGASSGEDEMRGCLYGIREYIKNAG
jgi:hypothetical protein